MHPKQNAIIVTKFLFNSKMIDKFHVITKQRVAGLLIIFLYVQSSTLEQVSKKMMALIRRHALFLCVIVQQKYEAVMIDPVIRHLSEQIYTQISQLFSLLFFFFFEVLASGGLYFYYLHQQFTVLNNNLCTFGRNSQRY